MLKIREAVTSEEKERSRNLNNSLKADEVTSTRVFQLLSEDNIVISPMLDRSGMKEYTFLFHIMNHFYSLH